MTRTRMHSIGGFFAGVVHGGFGTVLPSKAPAPTAPTTTVAVMAVEPDDREPWWFESTETGSTTRSW